MQDWSSNKGETLIGRDYPDFNESLVFFLPKSSTVSALDGSPAYEAQNVRPLNVTNCDNRLIASAVRIALEPRIAPYITSSQRGFLKGRSMIANILDVDEAMAHAAIDGDCGLAFSFDLAAAFPSLERQFFEAFFESLGWPPFLLRIISNLYVGNFCWFSIGGERTPGFMLARGIRQGCPLSIHCSLLWPLTYS